MDNIAVEGQHTQAGEIVVSGAENAALRIMAATLLGPGEYVLRNVPDLRDTRTFIRLMELTGAQVVLAGHRLDINTRGCNRPEAPYELVKTMRASFYVLGPLLARFGRCRVSLPGVCNWGPRPAALHLSAVEALASTITPAGSFTIASGHV